MIDNVSKILSFFFYFLLGAIMKVFDLWRFLLSELAFVQNRKDRSRRCFSDRIRSIL